MPFQDLLDKGIIEHIEVNKEEINAIFNMIQQDLQTARILLRENRWDWAHNIAYNAVRQACLALAYAHGFRPKGDAKHKNTFVFAYAAMESKYKPDIERADKMRQQRNVAVYQKAGTVSEQRAKQNVEFVEKFTQELEMIIRGLLMS